MASATSPAGSLSTSPADEDARLEKWTKYMVKHPLKDNQIPRSDNTFLKLVRGGMPTMFRGQIWLQASGAYLAWRTEPDFYKKICKQALDHETTLVRDVEKDVERTFSDHPKFSAPGSVHVQQLRRILIAFGLRNPTVGYCQGMNFIAGLFLIMELSEEMAFWLLMATVEYILPEDYFATNLLGVQSDVRVFLHLVHRRLPRVAKRLEEYSVPASLALINWFLIGFIDVFPAEIACRIWDRVYVEGSQVLFEVGLAVLAISEPRFLNETNPSSLYSLLVESPRFASTQLERFWTLSGSNDFSVPIADVDKLREHFRAEVHKEMEAMAERRGLFRKRSEQLASESATDLDTAATLSDTSLTALQETKLTV